MQITYLIGNGFDLAMGLKTSYNDFITTYINIHPKNLCVQRFKREIIEPDLEYWSKMEEMIGDCTCNYSIDTLQDFCSCYDNLLHELSRYLSKQDSLFRKKNAQRTCKAFHAALFSLSKLNFNPENPVLTAMLSDQLMEDRDFFFVSFNYTKVFDRCLHQFRKSERIKSRVVAGKHFRDTIGPVLHIHGILEKLMIVGVNDETQINNRDLSSKKDIRNRIIKPDVMKKLSQTNAIQFSSLIDSSNVIILFGISIGSTDKIWWKKIGDWLITDPDHQLVIFVYLPKVDRENSGQHLVSIEETQDQFLINTDISPQEHASLRQRIQVIVNYPLFGSCMCVTKQSRDKTMAN